MKWITTVFKSNNENIKFEKTESRKHNREKAALTLVLT